MECRKAALTSFFLFMLLVLSAREYVGGAGARVCQFPSSGFKGMRFSDTNCAQVCIQEGYSGGQCEALRRRCLCQKQC